MSDMIAKALKLGKQYAIQALQDHDLKYCRHPATESDRQEIVDDVVSFDEALAALSSSGQGAEEREDSELVELWAVVMEAIVEIDHGRPAMARKILVDAYDDGLPCQRYPQPAAPAPEPREAKDCTTCNPKANCYGCEQHARWQPAQPAPGGEDALAESLSNTLGRLFGALDPDCLTYEQARIKAKGIIATALRSKLDGKGGKA